MKNLIWLTILFFVIIGFYSCSDDDDTTTSAVTSGLDGQWLFTMSPLNVYHDTTVVKGFTDADFTVDPSINDEVFLYQAGNDVIGFAGPFEFRGTLTDSLRLDIFEPAEGPYGADTSMIKSAEMSLALDAFGFLNGNGKIVLDWDTTGVTNDTYTIFARKIGNINADFKQADFKRLKLSAAQNWARDLCDLDYSALSLVVGYLTDGVIRLMGNCGAHKFEGGYFVFGHYGPGSLLPAWTQTVYYPMEWSFCKVRKYHFDVHYVEPIRDIQALLFLLRQSENFCRNLGFDNMDTLIALTNDFYNKYGHFSITMAFSELTHQAGFYVNVANDDHNAHEHRLLQIIKNKLDHYFRQTFFYSGKYIYDTWHIRRSDFFVCSIPLVFCYLFGTIEVNLD